MITFNHQIQFTCNKVVYIALKNIDNPHQHFIVSLSVFLNVYVQRSLEVIIIAIRLIGVAYLCEDQLNIEINYILLKCTRKVSMVVHVHLNKFLIGHQVLLYFRKSIRRKIQITAYKFNTIYS